MSEDLAFRYAALDRAGRQVRDVVRAVDARAAAQALAAQGLTPLSLEADKSAARQGRSRDFNFSEKMAVIGQLALMVEAGVSLLEALQTVTPGVVANKGRAKLEATIAALKRGEPFDEALVSHAPGFPFYVYAMTRVGQATGRLGQVLRDAAEQMGAENRLRREFAGAMTYPAFLMTAGVSAVLFIFTQVVPRFSTMLGDKLGSAPLVSRLVLRTGAWSNAHMPLVFGAVALLAGLIAAAVYTPSIRKAVYVFARKTPLIGGLLRRREIAAWARLCGFSLSNGVGLLEAAALARRGALEGPFRDGLVQFERDLKVGVAIDVSLGRHTELTAMDLSLLRAGQKSGALPKMFLYVADAYEARLKDDLKRLTTLVEPITIGLIAVLVGTLAISIVLALVSVYDTIQ
jgi:general secretion pathway protein F